MVVPMKIEVFWDMMLCQLAKKLPLSRGVSCLHNQNSSIVTCMEEWVCYIS